MFNKLDMATGRLPETLQDQATVAVSALDGDGVEGLLTLLGRRAAAALEGGGGPVMTRARHRVALGEAEVALRRALDAGLPELVAEDVRVAMRSIGRITGRVDVEDMLDVIFKEFCIGK